MWYWVAILTLTLGIFFTYLVRKFALHFNILDYPDQKRKFHFQPTPLLGGLAVFLTFTIITWSLALFTDNLIGKDVSLKQLIAITLAGLFLMIGGYLDDRYNLSWNKQIIWPILASLIVIIGGIGIKFVTNPFTVGLIYFDSLKIKIFTIGNIPYYLTWWADLFTFIWLMVLMYTTKLLDGLDGLVSGVGTIGGLIIFGLTQVPSWYQPSIGLLAITLAGACLGFLIWHWHPAKIFLGEGGSLYIGFMLGILAIISGGKIATALLIMGIPILDVVWVIVRRLFWNKKKISEADRKHLHFRLLEVGLSHRQSVLVLYFLTAVFGISSLFLRTQGKIVALLILALVMILLALSLILIYHHKIKKGKYFE